MSTDMVAGWDVPKSDPRVAVGQILDASSAGGCENLDADTAGVKRAPGASPEELYSVFGVARAAAA